MKQCYQWQDFTIELETDSTVIPALIQKYTNFLPVMRAASKPIRLVVHDLKGDLLSIKPPVDAKCISKGQIRLEEVRNCKWFQQGVKEWRIYEKYGAYCMDKEKQLLVVERLIDQMEFDYYAVLLLILMPMMELLRGKGYYRFHAGCAVVNGRSILLSGTSGSGKSTATFALMKKEWPVLSDEMPLIRHRNGQYEAAVLSDTVKICQDSRHRFFQGFLNGLPCEHWKGEWYFHLRDVQLLPEDTLKNIQHLFVLKQTGVKKTKIVPLHPAKAVSALFPVTLRLGQEKEVEKTFHFVMTFLERIECYQVEFGTDMDDFVESLKAVLNESK